MVTVGIVDAAEGLEAVAVDRTGPAGREWRAAQPLIEIRWELATRLNLTRTGLPSAVVSTTATKGVLPALPRPRLPPERLPAM